MPNNETTTKFKVDISELKKNMQDAKRSIAVTNSEFKAISSTMDDWSKSTDGISAKLKQLDKNISSQKSILASLEKQYELTVKEMGAGSKAADDLRIKINNQKSVINNTEKEISKYKEALDEVAAAEKTAAKTGKTVAEVLEDVGDSAKGADGGFSVLKGTIATFAGNVLTGLANGLKNAASNLLNIANETREYRTEMGKLDTAFATAGVSAEAATDTYKDLYAVLGDEGQAVEAASHLAKLADSEKDLSKWTKIATGVYGTFGASLPIESLAEASNETAKTGQITGALADALNWAGVSEEEFQKTLDGCSTEQERQAKITDTLNGLYSDAAEKYEETNESVMEANRANSDYADTMAGLGEKIEPVTTTLKNGFNDLLSKVLELVEGVDMSAFTSAIESGFAVLTDTVLPAVKDGLGWIIENKDTLIAGLAGIAAGFVAFKVASFIRSAVTAIQGMTTAQAALNAVMSLNPIGLIVAAIAGLVAAFVVLWNKSEAFRGFWIGLWENIKSVFDTAVSGVVTFFTETIPAVFTGVIDFIKENWNTLLTFLINPFAGLFKYFYENNKKFKEFVDTAVNFIKELPPKVWTWLKNTIDKVTTWRDNMTNKAKETASNFLNKIIEFFKQLPPKAQAQLSKVITNVANWGNNMLNRARQTASGFINNVISFVKQLPSKVWTWLSTTASKVGDWGGNLARKGKEAASKLFNSIVDKIKELPSKLTSIGSDIVRGLWNGIGDMAGWIGDKISGFGDGILSDLKSFFGINSPSRLMRDEVGKYIPQGIAVGIDQNAKSVLNSMRELTTGTVAAARDSLSAGAVTSGSMGATYNFYQTNNSPKALSRLDIYRQSKNLLGFAGGV